MPSPDRESDIDRAAAWPELPLQAWRDTYATLHMWTQVIGKIRLAQAPLVNHWWQVPLYVTPRGLTTSPVPYRHRSFQIDFDFISHALHVASSDGERRSIELRPMSVAAFHRQVMDLLRTLGLDVHIWTTPVEIANPIPFEADHQHAAYDADHVNRFWRILLQVDRVFTLFRARYIGKVSPVHFFWGSFDLAVTRFSGRPAPVKPDADRMTREAYSHEVSSCGFWPGGDGVEQPAFYSYAYPEPEGFAAATVRRSAAFYDSGLGQFILPYDAVRQAESPDDTLLEFLQATYVTAATLGKWDRSGLERPGS
jgi:hypothetical protein